MSLMFDIIIYLAIASSIIALIDMTYLKIKPLFVDESRSQKFGEGITQ